MYLINVKRRGCKVSTLFLETDDKGLIQVIRIYNVGKNNLVLTRGTVVASLICLQNLSSSTFINKEI